MARIVKSPDIRRQELLDIGFDLYVKNGMPGLSIKEITEQADVATGLFYYYFKSKEDFVDEAINRFIVKNVEGMQKILAAETQAPPEKIRRALNAFWAHARQSVYYRSQDGTSGRQHFALTNQLLEQVQPVLLQVVQDGIRSGDFCVANPALTTRFILYGLSGVLGAPEAVTGEALQDMQNLVFTALGVSDSDKNG